MRQRFFSSPLPVAVIALGSVLLGFYLARKTPSSANASPAVSVSAAQDMRAEIARVIQAEVSNLKTEAEVRTYLVRLEQRAQSQGRVSALEVEPGYAAIERLTALPPKEAERMRLEFGTKMSDLGRDLRAR